MSYDQALSVIWCPDMHPSDKVLEAAATVLASLGAKSEEVYQATHLVTSRRR